jgi:hypothetical protein
MKKNNKGLAFLLFAAAILAMSVHCQNPFDQGPGDDDLLPPPEPPVPTGPVNDTVYYYDGTHPFPQYIQLSWTSVEGTEIYQVQVSRDSTFTGSTPADADVNSYLYGVSANGKYYWRARAYSTKWEWYTGWSEIWKFSAYYSPGY